jgi:type I restriction enzyme S subunit
MPKNWKTYKLSDFIDINPLVKLKANQSYSFVEMKDLDANLKTVKPSDFKTLKGGAKFQNNDTLFARITPCLENGKICQVRDLENNVGFGSTEFLVFRGKENISDSDFVYYLSREPFVRQFAEANMIGTSGRQRVSKEAFQNIELELPPLQEQKSIADILSAIDDKIENNLAINKTLEEMAMALYKHWFVDFGPFQDGEFVESELGRIPKGWEVKSLDEICYIKGGKRLPKGSQLQKEINEHPYIRVKDFNSIFLMNLGLEYVPNNVFNTISSYIVNTKDIVLSIVGTIGSVAIIGENLNNASLTENCVKISCVSNEFPSELIYLHLKSFEIMEDLKNKTVGSTQPKLPIYNIKKIKIQLPKDFSSVEIPLSEIINSIDLIYNNLLENQTLTQLRDTLLPKLISGEVRLKEFRE